MESSHEKYIQKPPVPSNLVTCTRSSPSTKKENKKCLSNEGKNKDNNEYFIVLVKVNIKLEK